MIRGDLILCFQNCFNILGEKIQSKLTKCYERLFVFMNYIIDILCVNRALEEDESGKRRMEGNADEYERM